MSKEPSIRCGVGTSCAYYESTSISECSLYSNRNDCTKSRRQLARLKRNSRYKERNKYTGSNRVV